MVAETECRQSLFIIWITSEFLHGNRIIKNYYGTRINTDGGFVQAGFEPISNDGLYVIVKAKKSEG